MTLTYNPADFWLTFNVATILTALVTGLMFGFFAFVPMIELALPASPPPPLSTPRRAFWAAFVILLLVIGSIVTVYYVEQVVTEVTLQGMVPMRAVGRYCTFVVFLIAFSAGVGGDVYRTTGHRRSHAND